MSAAFAVSAPTLANERSVDAPAVDALVQRAFGPGRFAKAAERLREGRTPRFDLSFVAWDEGRIVGCVQLWDVTVGGAAAVLLGPIAVNAESRSQGLGAALVVAACEAAEAAGVAHMVLVGDMPFFGPLGFEPAPKVAMPGPVDQRRVLVRALAPDTAMLEGPVAPA